MRPAPKLLTLAALTLASAACHNQKQPASDQNISIDEGPMSNGLPANADIETLPPDESSTTPSNELDTGSDEPNTNADGSANSTQ